MANRYPRADRVTRLTSVVLWLAAALTFIATFGAMI